jgi:hypothetical protein
MRSKPRFRLFSVAVLTSIALASGSHTPVCAATVQNLLATAERNTNTVRTIVHRDSTVIKTPNLTVTSSVRGVEDEVHNRERDFESVTVTGKTSKGVEKTLHYTADVVFMNGFTYYRTTLAKNIWMKQKGMNFRDPYTGGFARGRTTVSFLKSVVFKEVGVGGGETHVRASAKDSKSAGTVDLWIRNGMTPYVVRLVIHSHSTKGTVQTETSSTEYGPFNAQQIIQAPTTGAST